MSQWSWHGALLGSAALCGAGAAPAQEMPVGVGEVFQIDDTHSELEFGVRLFGMGRVKGAFREYSGTLLYDTADPTRSSITVVFQTSSIDTDNQSRDNHLRSPEFLDAVRYPTALFESRRIERAEDGFTIHGDLTLRGLTRPLSFVMTPAGAGMSDHVGNTRMGLAGTLELKRGDFGIVGGSRFNPNFVMSAAISDEIAIELDLMLVRWNYAGWSYRGDRPAIAAMMERTIASRGLPAALDQFHAARAGSRDSLDFSPLNLLVLGHKLLKAGRAREAAGILQLYAEEDARSTRARWSLALAHAATGNRPGAISALEQAMALDSNDTVVRELLRRLR